VRIYFGLIKRPSQHTKMMFSMMLCMYRTCSSIVYYFFHNLLLVQSNFKHCILILWIACCKSKSYHIHAILTLSIHLSGHEHSPGLIAAVGSGNFLLPSLANRGEVVDAKFLEHFIFDSLILAELIS